MCAERWLSYGLFSLYLFVLKLERASSMKAALWLVHYVEVLGENRSNSAELGQSCWVINTKSENLVWTETAILTQRSGEDCQEQQFNQLQSELLEAVVQPSNTSELFLYLPFYKSYGFWRATSLYNTEYSQSGLSAGTIFEKS